MEDRQQTPAQRNFNFQKIIAVTGAVLMLAKFFAYLMTHSVSILTDAMESIVNVVAGFIGLYALYLSMQPADSNHPYGHGKIELISSTTEGALISVAGALIIIESVGRIISGDFSIRDLDFGLIIVAIAAAVNFAMGFTAIKMGISSKSMALEASGRHLCSDTYSSIGILLGLGVVYVCSVTGIDANWIDPAMALLFGAFIIYTGIRVMYRSMNGIMDQADMDMIRPVTRCINRVRTPDVIDVHHLRVNKYGAAVHVDVHMVFPGTFTVDETQNVVDRFRSEIRKEFGEEVDLTLMIDPCRKVYCSVCGRECPNRVADFEHKEIISTSSAVRSDSEENEIFH